MLELLVTLNLWDSFMGVLSSMMQPLYWAISGLIVFFHWVFTPLLGADSGLNWALSIIMLTVTVRTILIPLFVKQINSARNMQLLQPKLAELQKKYGHDREKLGQESMKLYQEEGVNPMASCLPMIIQMPVFLALFRVLQGVASNQIRGYYFKTNPDLVTSLQNAEFFGARLAGHVLPLSPFGATQIVGIILVVIMVALFVVTQLQMTRKNMPPESQVGQAAQMQKMMLYVFPVVYAFSAVVVPIGVLVYWATSNLWTLGQQWILIRNNPAPNTPAYIDWEERMIAKGKDPKAIIAARAEKRRKTKKSGGLMNSMANATQSATGDADKPKVVRQQVARQTVRTNEEGQRVVQRQQPRQQSRSTRKKK